MTMKLRLSSFQFRNMSLNIRYCSYTRRVKRSRNSRFVRRELLICLYRWKKLVCTVLRLNNWALSWMRMPGSDHFATCLVWKGFLFGRAIHSKWWNTQRSHESSEVSILHRCLPLSRSRTLQHQSQEGFWQDLLEFRKWWYLQRGVSRPTTDTGSRQSPEQSQHQLGFRARLMYLPGYYSTPHTKTPGLSTLKHTWPVINHPRHFKTFVQLLVAQLTLETLLESGKFLFQIKSLIFPTPIKVVQYHSL